MNKFNLFMHTAPLPEPASLSPSRSPILRSPMQPLSPSEPYLSLSLTMHTCT